MSADQTLAAGLLCIGFDGPSVTDDLRRLVRMGVRTVILFTRNYRSPSQLFELTRAIKSLVDEPVTICVDHEGGRSQRFIDGFTRIPSMRRLGAAGDEHLGRAIGCVMGTELRAVNVDANFAPVLDVDTNPANPVIADRSLAAEPETVARLGIALMEGMQQCGVAAVGKHFPGHGDTHQDSHFDLPRLEHGLDRLRRVELLPFQRAAAAGISAIMTAHVVFTALDQETPATMSRRIIQGILREQIGFEGVVISDDLEMKAIAAQQPIPEALVRCIRAGVDLAEICHTPAEQFRCVEHLTKAVERDAELRLRATESTSRLQRWRARFTRPAGSSEALQLVGCDRHHEVVARLV